MEEDCKTICVYCGSSDKMLPAYLEAAQEMGRTIATRKMRLVYGAGMTGLMGAVADGALSQGGEVIGVIPEIFNTPQLRHTRLTKLDVVADMHTRKARMVALADAFIALPGGYGTLDEFFEILTWAQIGLHQKPIGLLNTRNYFAPLLAWVDHAAAEGFIYAEHRHLFTVHEEPWALLDLLQGHRPPANLARWLTRDE
ncbi:MAG: TIGR00730 family Rossman fold protein [Chloroflexota bacterium]